MTENRMPTDPEEVRRDRIVWTTLIILGVLVAAGVLGLGWRAFEGRLDAAKRLDRAMALLKQSDSTIASVDEIIRSGVSSAAGARAAEIAPQVDTASSELAEANILAATGFERLTDDEQERALLVQAAAKARGEMLSSAREVLDATGKAALAAKLADEAWTRMLAADDLARQSVADYNKLTAADVRKGAAAGEKATAGFTAARDLFSEAASAFPEAGLGEFVSYVDGRLALVALSTRAEKAWLAGKSGQADKLISSYNKQSDAIVRRAKKLPGPPDDTIAQAYRALADGPSSAYVRARERVVEADTALRTL